MALHTRTPAATTCCLRENQPEARGSLINPCAFLICLTTSHQTPRLPDHPHLNITTLGRGDRSPVPTSPGQPACRCPHGDLGAWACATPTLPAQGSPSWQPLSCCHSPGTNLPRSPRFILEEKVVCSPHFGDGRVGAACYKAAARGGSRPTLCASEAGVGAELDAPCSSARPRLPQAAWQPDGGGAGAGGPGPGQWGRGAWLHSFCESPFLFLIGTLMRAEGADPLPGGQFMPRLSHRPSQTKTTRQAERPGARRGPKPPPR